MNDESNKWQDQLDELVVALYENELDEHQSHELRKLLETQPGARRRLAEQMQLVAMLQEGTVPDTLSNAAGQSAKVSLSSHESVLSRTFKVVAAVAAVGLLMLVAWSLGGHRFSTVSNQQKLVSNDVMDDGVAVVTRTVGARWNDRSDIGVGTSVSPGVLNLSEGLAQFEFYRGAVVVLEGPAEIEFVDADKVVCRHGKLRAHVPPQAEGFTVLSSQFELVDLGTEFGVDIAEDGSANVHVFEGKVELYESGSDRSDDSRVAVDADGGMLISARGEFMSIEDDAERVGRSSFVSSSELEALADQESQSRYLRWREQSEKLRNDPRVVVYYSFDGQRDSDRTLPSHLSQDRSLDGAIVGCSWSTGRWPGKSALDFKRPGDRVRFHIPGEYGSLTYSAWVRIDGLDRPFIALMLTNGYDAGEPHWQLRDDGRLLLGVRGPDRHMAYDSDPFLNIKHVGQWIHLVSVYDGANAEVIHFANGQIVGRQSVQTEKVELKFGDTEIGNWGTPVNYSPQKIRNLNGRIDELVLFGDALTEEEIKELYLSGKP